MNEEPSSSSSSSTARALPTLAAEQPSGPALSKLSAAMIPIMNDDYCLPVGSSVAFSPPPQFEWVSTQKEPTIADSSPKPIITSFRRNKKS